MCGFRFHLGWLLLLLAGAAYLLWPAQTNLLVFGIDYTVPWEATARSDSILLLGFNPVSLRAVPRMSQSSVALHPDANGHLVGYFEVAPGNHSHAFERYDLVSAPVVDDRGKLVGRVTVAAVVDFIRDQSDSEMLNLAGLREDGEGGISGLDDRLLADVDAGVLALREAGLRVPDDMSVVAFDDLPEEWVSEPFLTVAAQPAYEIGHRAAALLLDQITGSREPAGESVELPFELIIRRSSAPPPAPVIAGALALAPAERAPTLEWDDCVGHGDSLLGDADDGVSRVGGGENDHEVAVGLGQQHLVA